MAEKKKRTTSEKKSDAKKKPIAKKKASVAKKAVAKKEPKAKKKMSAPKKMPSIKKSPGKENAVTISCESANFPIVGIGASAGGLEALEAFFSHMRSDSNIAFVVIQHLSPRHKSIMGPLLSKCTEMKVMELEDGMEVEPNRVYLNPPNKNVVIMNRTLQLLDPIKTDGVNLPIDCFFRSMADELMEKAICIILSGTATDGTLGLKAVKGEGGIAMVQDPDSAKYDGMPRSAIATGLVDFILPVEKMPQELVKYVQTPYIEGARRVKVTDDEFGKYIQKVFSLIRTATGNDLSHYKQGTTRRRIERRMAVHQINRIIDYVKYLQRKPAEVDTLFKDMLIGVTNLFRDQDAFKVLKEKAFPELLKSRKPDAQVRAWVVGCSTGEEAYSMAILFTEAMAKLKEHYNIQIFATDIDSQAIDYARMGIYPDSIAADVSQKRLKQFFIKENNTYKVKKQIRDMIVFAVQNVIKDPPFSKIDLVSCRNLLIYMDSELQKNVLSLCHYTLNKGGILFLGPSESIGEFTDFFQPIDNKWKIFQRKDFAAERTLDYPGMAFISPPVLEEGEKGKVSVAADIHSVAERIILENYAPPGVLVNERYEIIHFMGKTDRYLEIPTGKASFNIIKMAREGLRFKLSTALHNAVRQKKTTSYPALRIKHNNQFRIIDLTVRPLIEGDLAPGFFLVMFDDKTPAEKPAQGEGKKAIKDSSNPIIASLERELDATKEHLQTTIEEMETSNEELKSTNEELQSVNEELQSTNEELETSKEELQSTNEELVTVNTELQKKVDELSEVNNDINNLLASTEIGTIFLDIDLCIKRFTPAMTKIFNLIQTDIGRPIRDITSKIRYENLRKDAKEVLRTLSRKEVEVQSLASTWFAMRISPYRTTENVIDGVVITFVDITNKVKQTDNLRRLATVVKDSNDAITVQDFEGNIKAWNRGAQEIYGWGEEDALSMKIYDIVPNNKREEEKAFSNKIQNGQEIDSFETQRITKDGRIIDVWLTVTKLVDKEGRPVEIATTEREVKDKGQAV